MRIVFCLICLIFLFCEATVYNGPDGAQLFSGVPFTLPSGTKYPANWLDVATSDDLAKAGIIKSTVADPPPPPPPPPVTVVSWSIFVGRFTDTEWAGVQKAINNQVTAGNGALARWVAMAVANGVDMAATQTATYKGQLVTAAILTQVRADVIFVAP